MSTSVRTVVTSCLRIETEALSTMDHNSLEAIHLPTSRTFWNCNNPSLDPFDDTLVPTMASTDEACSSTFQHLFPNSICSDSSTCDESEPIFNTTPPSHEQSPNIIFSHVEAGGAHQATAQSYSCTNDESSLFTWSLPSSPPHYNHPEEAGELGAGEHYDGGLDPAIFGPLSSDQVPFLKVPQPSNWGAGKERNSWQLSAMSGAGRNNNIFHPVDPPLGSPCSVISGFTKALQEGDSHYNMSHEGIYAADQSITGTVHNVQAGCGVHKRKRSKVPRGSNEVESQRMTHIAVERNRRKQMNEHLAALRALMPGSYVQKGDQASIVGGAIEFVKELEHLLVCLQSQKRRRAYSDLASPRTPTGCLAIHLPDPQPISQIISTTPAPNNFSFHSPQIDGTMHEVGRILYPQLPSGTIITEQGATIGEVKSEVASVEVRMLGPEQAALVKVMAVRRSGQLLRTVVALESLGLTVVHANITTVNHTVLYSFQVHHVGPGAVCARIMSAQETAVALHQTFSSLHSLQF